MRYMLMMNAPTGTGTYQINSWSPEDIKSAHRPYAGPEQEAQGER